MGIILIAFIILGTFLMVFVNQFWDTRNLNKAKEDLNSYVLLTSKALENKDTVVDEVLGPEDAVQIIQKAIGFYQETFGETK